MPASMVPVVTALYGGFYRQVLYLQTFKESVPITRDAIPNQEKSGNLANIKM